VMLTGDAGGVRARRVLKRLIEAEAKFDIAACSSRGEAVALR